MFILMYLWTIIYLCVMYESLKLKHLCGNCRSRNIMFHS